MPRPVARGTVVAGVSFSAGGIGYLYGDATWVTNNAGQRWRRLDGRHTEALTIDRGGTYRIGYHHSGCPATCHPVVQLSSTGTRRWRTIDRLGGAGDGASITSSGPDVLVTLPGNPAGGAPNAHTEYAISTDGGTTWHERGDPCGGAGRHEQDTAAVSMRDAAIAALCVPRHHPERSRLVVSVDAGTRFSARSRSPIGARAITITREDRIIAATGTTDGRGAVTYRIDAATAGSRAWRPTLTDRSTTGSDVTASVQCVGAGCVYLADPHVLYISQDDGQVWHRRPF